MPRPSRTCGRSSSPARSGSGRWKRNRFSSGSAHSPGSWNSSRRRRSRTCLAARTCSRADPESREGPRTAAHLGLSARAATDEERAPVERDHADEAARMNRAHRAARACEKDSIGDPDAPPMAGDLVEGESERSAAGPTLSRVERQTGRHGRRGRGGTSDRLPPSPAALHPSRPLARPGVRPRPLPPHGEAAAVAKTSVDSELLQALDVLTDDALQVPLDGKGAGDRELDPADLCRREFPGALGGLDGCPFEHVACSRSPDAVDRGKRDPRGLRGGNLDSQDERHV